MAFVPLFCQSHHSTHGVAAPADLVRRARAVGYNTLGICDESTIAGFHDFDEACTAQGIRPVFGCRLYIMGLAETGLSFPLDLLIETEQGYRNLVRLLTEYHQAGTGEHRPLAPDRLENRAQGLHIIIPPDGELLALTRERDRTKTERFLKRAVELFGASLVLGVTHPTLRIRRGTQESKSDEEPAGFVQLIQRLGHFAGIRVMTAEPVLYPEPGDAAAAVFLENPRQAPGRAYTPPADLKSLPALRPEDEILARWSGDSEDLPHETGNVARRCTWRPGRVRRAFPTLDLERGFDPNSYLFDLAIRGATQRYGEITESLKQRINREFEDVKTHSLAPYLLLCHHIAQALDSRGVSRGVGRGRVVASVLAYCLGITRLDPLAYNLVAKTLVTEGETCPAVHIETPRGGAETLLQWLRETFGDDRLVEIGRIQEWRRDQMINELANWAGMTADERRLAHREKIRLRSTGAAQRLDEMAEGARSRRWRDPAFLGDLAARLSPRPRHWMGLGDRYVLSGDPLEVIVPRVRSQQGRAVSGIEEAALDRLGVARIAFAPHQLLDILDQALRHARQQNPGLDFQHIPLDDGTTFDLLAHGDTAGIPPLEGVTVRCLLRKVAPVNLLQLLRIKTEAGQGRPTERPRELSDELPDVLLSYQCAFLKANYPLAFFSAAIGAVIDQRGNPAALLRAARRMNFEVQPPDINLSDWGATLHSGQIRLGLAAVRHFGRRAWENVEAVRSGGPFTSLDNFCERVDLRLLNLRILRALIGSGAMDSLDPHNRAAMDAQVTRLQRRLRERERSGGASQATLFELDEWSRETDDAETLLSEGARAESAEPESNEQGDWNLWDRIQRETDALGFYLSIDPIQRFRIALDHLKPELVQRFQLRPGRRAVRLAGLVCATERDGPLIAEPGQLLLDLEGIPVLLPAPVAEVSRYCLEPGTEVMVLGRVINQGGYPMLRAEGIWRLTDLEDQATKVGALGLILAGENRHTLKLLIELLTRYPGQTELRPRDYPERKGWTYRRLARLRVFFCSPLYQGLCKILPVEAIELYGHNNEPLLVKTSAAELRAESLSDEEPPEPSS